MACAKTFVKMNDIVEIDNNGPVTVCFDQFTFCNDFV